MVRLLFAATSRLAAAAERARIVHSAWLTRAVRDRAGTLPRIPTRRVDRGGFEAVRSTPEGRAWADDWWHFALDRVDSYNNTTRRRHRHGR